MEIYGMAAPFDDDTIDCYQQYVAQTGYKPELPWAYDNPTAGDNKPNNGGMLPGESNNNNSFGNYGASNNPSNRPMLARRDLRNGLVSQEAPRAGGNNKPNNGGWLPGESKNNHSFGNYGASNDRSNRPMLARRNLPNGLVSQEVPRAGGGWLPGEFNNNNFFGNYGASNDRSNRPMLARRNLPNGVVMQEAPRAGGNSYNNSLPGFEHHQRPAGLHERRHLF